ncbi:MAG TPA: enoyl-CoA hydratase [Acidimicrobiales bacterium]|nr:enoyl-CoA hydratase [Acidimicrobiales bacterium]
MSLDPEAVGLGGGPNERSWNSTDAILYALGVGAGAIDPTGFELEFTTENSHDVTQRVLPTMAVVLGIGGSVAKAGDIDWGKLLHGSQGITLHREIPPEGRIVCHDRITGIWDKGEGRHAIIDTEIEAKLAETGEPLFTSRSSVVIRGSGGFGGEPGDTAPKVHAPDREPDHEVTYDTRTDQALLYRLNGDRNPLHSDPWFATELAGFPKPILHGLCTYGFTGRALLHVLCDSDPSRFRSMDGRFTAVVFPGDSLTVRMWDQPGGAIFRTVAQAGTEQERVVLDNGLCTFD